MEQTLQQNNVEVGQTGAVQKRRFWELDFVRGLCVILMVLDHFLYSVMDVMPMVDEMLGKTVWQAASAWVLDAYWYSKLRITVRFFVLGAFFTLCGISCTFSRSNLKRGSTCFLVGCGITFVTVLIDRIFDMGLSIYFGVLHMLGLSMLVYGLLQKCGDLIAKIGKDEKTKKITRAIGDYLAPAVGLILVIVYFACWSEGIEGDSFVTNVSPESKTASMLASLFVDVKPQLYGYVIGGADYWPLLPWAAFVLLGGAIGVGLYRSRAKNYLAPLDGKWNKPVCFVGRHALFIYVAHQVAVVVILFLLTLIL